MKKFRFLSLLGIVLLAGSLAGCLNNSNDDANQTGDFVIEEDTTAENDAVADYNDTLVALAFNCITSENDIWDVYNNESADVEDMQKAIDNTVSKCTDVLKGIKQLGDWEGDSSLKDGTLNLIEKAISYYTKIGELLPYLQKDELTDEESAAYDNLFSEVENLDNELVQANANLITIQEEFAENHGFELGAEETTEEVIEEIAE